MTECFDFMDTNGSQFLLSPNTHVGSNRLLSANSTKAVDLNEGKVPPHSWIDAGMKRVSGFETHTQTHTHTHTSNSDIPLLMNH